MARHVAFIQTKGGCGKTALARELATYIASRGKRVLAVDLDPTQALSRQAGVGQGMDRSQYGVIAALMGSGAGAVLPSERLGFDVIVGGSEDDFAKVEVLEAGKTDLVLRMVEAVEDNYDFVFYDVKGGLEFWAKNALSAAHFVIAPVEGYDAVATARTVKQEVPAGVGFGVVTMRLRKGENDYGDVFFELDAQGLLGDVIGSVRKSADVSRAPKFGPAVIERAGKLPASELMDIGDWIIDNVAVGEAVA